MFNWFFKKRQTEHDMLSREVMEIKTQVQDNRRMILENKKDIPRVQDFIAEQMLERIAKK